jgi:hypothetical protein
MDKEGGHTTVLQKKVVSKAEQVEQTPAVLEVRKDWTRFIVTGCHRRGTWHLNVVDNRKTWCPHPPLFPQRMSPKHCLRANASEVFRPRSYMRGKSRCPFFFFFFFFWYWAVTSRAL